MDAFLRELKARGAGDLSGALATLNDGGLCQEALRHWLLNGWIVVAPHSPLLALAGPGFSRELTVRQFCGEEAQPALPEPEETTGETEKTKGDEDH